MTQKQNPGWRAGASCDQIGVCSHAASNLHQRQAQFLSDRLRLSDAIAREVSKHCFGEAAND